MQLGKDLERKMDGFWNDFIGMEESKRSEFHKEITGTILEAIDCRSAEPDDIEALRTAARVCINRRMFGDNLTEAFAENLIKAVRELDESRGVTKECRILWIRVLMAALERPYIRDAARDIRISHLNSFFYHALEAEADEDPNGNLMIWYEELIDRGMPFKYECRMFNRLAYFWLTAYNGQDHIDRAKAYFKAMERRGIDFENPYNGYYGKSNHEELVGYVLNDEYIEKRREYLNKYVSGLAKEISEGNAEEADLIDLRMTMYELHSDNHYSENDKAVDSWDQAVTDMCKALEKCCNNLDNEKSIEAAGELADGIAQFDNWLLRYIGKENEYGTEESYYSLIEEWERRISSIPNDMVWVMLSSLREILISRYNKTGETDKLIKMLEKHTGSTDAAAHLRGWILMEDSKSRRYCTHNTMALIKLLIDKGDRPAAEKIIDRIDSDAGAVEEACFLDPSGDFRNLWLKYTILLEENGYSDGSRLWKEKLKSEADMTDAELACELNYLKGEYEKALSNCEGNQDVFEMLEYITRGELPKDVDPKEISILEQKSPDSIHCRGYYVGEEMRQERQLTNLEWHQFYTDMNTLAKMHSEGMRGQGTHSIYPADYYKIELTYQPEPPIMRGDYIKHFFERNGEGNWLGLTKADIVDIEKAVSESTK